MLPRRVCVVVSSRACEQNNDGVNGRRSLTPLACSGPRRDLQPSHLATRPAQPTPHPPLMFMGAYRRRASGKVSQGGERGRKERSDVCARARAFFHLFLPPVCFRFCVCASACRDGVRGRPPRPPPPAPRPGVRTNHPGLDRPGLTAMVAPLAARPGRSRWTLTLSRSWCRSLLCIGGGHEKVPALPTPKPPPHPVVDPPTVGLECLSTGWVASGRGRGRGVDGVAPRARARPRGRRRPPSPSPPRRNNRVPPPPPPAPALFLTRRRPRPPPPPGLFRPSVLAQ